MLDPVSILDRAPRGLRRLAHRVASGRGMLGKAADLARYRFSKSQIPGPLSIDDSAVRLTIGPANSASQGFMWARSAERYLSDVSAVAMYGIGTNPFAAQTDLQVPPAVYQRSRLWHERFETHLANQTHVIWESGLPLLGRRYNDITREIARITKWGVRGALMFHGSDIRPPALHAAQNKWSPFRDPTAPVHMLGDDVARNMAVATGCGLPVFVSTPDLLQWLPDATWCPVVVDPAVWRTAATKPSGGARPIVAHAPSQAWLKGTSLIEPILHKLSDEGVIEYRQTPRLTHESMRAFYGEADVVLDQFLLGIYGVAACEAMASGRIVMAHVSTFTRNQVRSLTGLDLPIHEVTVDSLEDELRRVAREPEAFDWLRSAGQAFVDRVHDGRQSAVAIAPFLEVSA